MVQPETLDFFYISLSLSPQQSNSKTTSWVSSPSEMFLRLAPPFLRPHLCLSLNSVSPCDVSTALELVSALSSLLSLKFSPRYGKIYFFENTNPVTVFSLCDVTICLSLCLQPHSHNPKSHSLFWSVYTACQRLHFLSHLSILVSNIGSSKHFYPLLCWFSYSTISKDWHIYPLLFIKKKKTAQLFLFYEVPWFYSPLHHPLPWVEWDTFLHDLIQFPGLYMYLRLTHTHVLYMYNLAFKIL